MSKSVKQLEKEVKGTLARIEKMERQKCESCGKIQPHQDIDGAKTCWRCGSY